MGSSPSNSRYNHSNLVLEYQFSLKKPSNYPRISFVEGGSLYEFHPDQQNDVFSDLRHIISDGDNQLANKFRKYKKINNMTKALISIAIMSVIGYITGSIFGYFPLISVFWILISTLIFISSISLAFYLLFCTSKIRKRSLIRWRQSIITKISTKTLEWQTKSKPFAFTIYYPIHDISYGRKNKIVNIRGIIRVTLGMPKFISRKEPIYFQAVPRNQYHAQITLPIDRYNDKNELKEGGGKQIIDSSQSLEISKKFKKRKQFPSSNIKYNGICGDDQNQNKNKISIKRHNQYRRERAQKLDNDQRDKISLISDDEYKVRDIGIAFEQNDNCMNNKEDKIRNVSKLQRPKMMNDASNKTSISIAVELDDNGNVHNRKQENDDQSTGDQSIGGITMSRRGTMDYEERKRGKIQRSKTLPIMINGENGEKILLQGIKTIINGQEVILINNNNQRQRQKPRRIVKRRNIGNMPISPVKPPDSDYNIVNNRNDVMMPMSVSQISISPMNQKFLLEMD